MLNGLYEAKLGGFLYKKRIAFKGKGKRGGIRTVIAFKRNDKAFFVYGYAKNHKSNINAKERKIYNELALLLFSYNNQEINHAVINKQLIEVI